MHLVSVYSAVGLALLLAQPAAVVSHPSTRRRVQPFGPSLKHHSFTQHATNLASAQLFSAFNSARPQDCKAAAISQAKAHTELDDHDFVVKDAYRSDHNGVTHVYLRQLHKGVEIINADMNINLDSNCKVISVGNTFHPHAKLAGSSSQSPAKSPATPSPATEPAHIGMWGFVRGQLGALGQVVLGVNDWLTGLDYWQGDHSEFALPQSLADSLAKVADTKDGSNGPLSPVMALVHLLKHIGEELAHDHDIHLEHVSSLTGEPYSVLKNVALAVGKEVPARFRYVLNEDGELEQVWDLELEMEENWIHGHVSATTGKVLSLVDWVADAQYNVYPLGVNDPLEGERALLKDPANENASPFGWHDTGNSKSYTDTRGNNVNAQANPDGGYEWENNHRPDGGESLIFDFPLNLTSQPKDYIDAAVTNLFYLNNMIHDLFYQYGFNEKAGNFQQNNFERGGLGNDAVIANAQDGSGYNNANFATPPDGRNGKMRMYVWNGVDPNRDGDLESGIVIHEYAHGISIRLTGGPANSGCLGWGEAGGMGEGWGDFFATILRMKQSDINTAVYPMGSYANGGEGIRRYPYSTNSTTNPSTYKIMDGPAYWGVHAKGEVWAEMLYEMYWALVDAYGFTPDWFSASHDHGNTLALQLVVDGLSLQPCRPSFMDARDAIIQADEVLTGGKNHCLLWKAFAKRGLGVDAKIRGDTPWGGGIRTDSFDAPTKCRAPSDNDSA
ncbi:hypothetical protein H4R34_002615 [Dimargaris verticillata]|uniref:Extracellular metalloproteinase n=1 Tax=Dimargaris verticillata TaxID=2761393 RepID=A0A9W8EDE6_9FUNG|nr:hypothetical protein H4R34_002615 [Dimargaris verticillata]